MIQSIARALEILDVLKEPDATFSIAELSDALALPPSTIHRILQTLCELRYVVKDERSHTYQLGPALIPLGQVAAHNLRLQDSAAPILKTLSEATNEDAFLVIQSGYKGIILQRVESKSALKIVDKFDYERDLHCGALRKVLLAYQSDDFISGYITQILASEWSYPKMSGKTLLAHLHIIQANGVGVSYGEYIDNAVGIAAPVFDMNGKIKASIGIVLPSTKVQNDAHLEQLKRMVKQSGMELSLYLGYSPSIVSKIAK